MKTLGGEELSTFQVSPYVNFQGRAREAMELYHKALGGSLTLQALDEQGAPKLAGPEDRVTYARLEADGALIIGSDGHPSYPAKVGENVALALSGADRERLARAFNILADGGVIKGALARQPWGGEVGWLMDKFGVNWMITVEQA